jgi:hypothetical protein
VEIMFGEKVKVEITFIGNPVPTQGLLCIEINPSKNPYAKVLIPRS